jgi:tetratricopeptide (TPR) repeat protein
VAVVLIVLLLLSGCGQSSFVSQRWSNFTAYYNTFYNAERAFEEGVAQVAPADERIDRTRLLSLFAPPAPVRDPRHFDDAVEKSADILRRHGNSRYVDDALMLIGQSYVYLQNYVGAVEKFEEVAALQTERRHEAQVWLARTLLRAERYGEAAGFLESVLAADEEVPDHWRSQYWLILGAAEAYQEHWTAARDALRLGTAAAPNRTLEARGFFLLGQVNEALGRHGEAEQAYSAAAAAALNFELTYAARYSAIEVAGLQGDREQALQRAERLARDGAYFERRAEPAYLAARILQAMEAPDAAVARYQALLNEREAPLDADVEGRIHYGLAELYRYAHADYERAAAHYDTAATRLGRTRTDDGPQRPLAPAAIADAEEQRAIFSQFAEAYQEVTHTDSLLELGALSQEEFQAFVRELREQRAAELAAERRTRARPGAGVRRELRASDVRAELQATADQQMGQQGQLGGQGGGQASGQQGAGFLSYRDPVRVQDALVGFVRRWGDRPLTPDWRRGAAARMQRAERRSETDTVETADTGMTEEILAQAERDEVLPPVDVSDVPRDAASRKALQARQRRAMYDVGNAFLLALNQPADAIPWYEQVLEREGNDELTLRALYALTQAHEAAGNPTAAARLEQELLTAYPDSDVAQQLRRDEELSDLESADGRSATATAAYRRAVRQWREAQPRNAIVQLLLLATAYDETDVAPQALYAAGSFILESLVESGRDPLTPLRQLLPPDVLHVAGLVEGGLAQNAEAPTDASAGRGQPADTSGSTQGPTSLHPPASVRALAQALLRAYAEGPRLPDAARPADMIRVGRTPADSVAARAGSREQAMGDPSGAPEPLLSVGVAPPAAAAHTAPPAGATVADVFRRLQMQYPAAAAAARAEQVARLLEEEADDKNPTETVPDAIAEEPAAEEAARPAVAGIPGPERDDTTADFAWAAGQHAISLVSWDNLQYATRSAATFRDRLRDQDVDVALFSVGTDEGTVYHVGAGPFATAEEATAALEKLEGTVPSGATVRVVPPQPEPPTD